MAEKFSTGLREMVAEGCSYKKALEGGIMKIFSGAAPATADAAKTGTLLVTITDDSGAHTNEVLSSGTVTLDSGAAGSVDTITVNSVEVMGAVVAFDDTLTVTAAAVATQINKYNSSPNYRATSSGAVVTIIALPTTGTGPNGDTVASTSTTIATTDGNMASGVASANGLEYGASVGGVISKDSGDVWSGVVASTGTAGYFRILGSVSDGGGSSTTLVRIQGTCGTSGADYNMGSTTLTLSSTHTIDTFSITLPAS